MEVNGFSIQAIETTIIEEKYDDDTLKKGTVLYHDLDGKFMTGFHVEEGLTQKRLKPEENIQQASFFTFFQSEDCDDITGTAFNMCGETVNVYSSQPMSVFMQAYNSSGEFNPESISSNNGTDNVSDNSGGSSSNNNDNDQDDEDEDCGEDYVLDENGDCVLDDRTEDDIIDNTDNDCVGDIITKLQEKDRFKSLVPDLEGVSHLSQIVLDLFGECKNYDLEITIAELGTDINGNFKNAETNGTESITLDDDLVVEATQLSIAKTLIHESMHVFINYNIYNNNTSSIVSDLNTYYQQYNNDSNLTHHNFMSQYVEALAYSLSAYDNHRQSIGYYTAMSWGGLESSDTYNALNNKNEIQRIIRNEREAKPDAKSTKCEP